MAATATPQRAAIPFLARPIGILVLVSVAHGVTHLYSALFPLIYPIIQREWDISYAALGALIGITSFFGGVLQLLFGFVGRFAPRHVALGLGNLFLGITTGLTGLTTGFGGFAALRFCAAVANAAQHPVGNSMIADRFPRERRGSALAVNFAGGNVGTLLVPITAVALIGAISWQGALWVFAVPGILMGLLLIFGPSQPTGPAVESERPRGSPIAQIRRILGYRNVAVLILASSVAAGGRGLGVLFTFVPLYLANGLGLAQAAIGVIYTAMLVGSVVGPMSAGPLSDRFGRKAVLLTSLLLAAPLTVLLAAVGQPGLMVIGVLLFFIGALAFTESPLIQSYLADSVPAGERDVLFGFYFAWVYGIGALWVWLIGAVIDRAGFGPAWWVVAGSYVGAAALLLLSREASFRHPSPTAV